jgi:hypothetical protein
VLGTVQGSPLRSACASARPFRALTVPARSPIGLLRDGQDMDPFLVDHAVANLSPSSVSNESVYSMCSTRRGTSAFALEEACTISGRMATIPPARTTHSTDAISPTRRWISASESTPSACVPGSTRRGPLSAGIVEMQAQGYYS